MSLITERRFTVRTRDSDLALRNVQLLFKLSANGPERSPGRIRVRCWRYSGRGNLWLARQFVTRSVTSPPSIAALRKAELPLVSGAPDWPRFAALIAILVSWSSPSTTSAEQANNGSRTRLTPCAVHIVAKPLHPPKIISLSRVLPTVWIVNVARGGTMTPRRHFTWGMSVQGGGS